MTVAEAATHATVSEGLIRQWVRDGTLPHFRVGAKGRRGKILIAVEDLDGALAGFKVGKKGPEPAKAPAPKSVTLRHLRMPS